ncbi:hypothetical protein [Paenarthrobacter sp. NPDC018779]|uniref:hypothetical protein n=1 Tax=Paenarthrobacter sp. NPDC018779 TaxID=3364375 RepID=UPI0037C960BA
MSNTHLDQAKSRLRNGTPNEVARAQAEATLALAYEQRTANLIAFEKGQWESWKNNELNKEGQELWTKAADQIAARLGLA